ncbi:hypothetical protein EDC96DRAFT_515533 [Choanephora cucurbitarum]|nr:hypothetical protein EDC96DRAFT_515533 [Choanephora cucurbitarum]
MVSTLNLYSKEDPYELFLKYPEALCLSFDRLKEKLEDSDPSVVLAAVSVISGC